MAGRYWWAKLMFDFFDKLEIRQLRSNPTVSGDLVCIVSLRIQLACLQSDGFIPFRRICPTIEDEIALSLSEDKETVKTALGWLETMGWATKTNQGYLVSFLDYGSEGESAARMRRARAKKNQIPSHCDATCRHIVTTEQTRQEQEKTREEQQQRELVEKYGVPKTVKALLREGHDQAKIGHALLLLDSAKTKVRNPGAWLRRAVEENWTDAEAEKKEAARKENAEIAAAAREAMVKERKEMDSEPITNDFLKKALKRLENEEL